MSTSKTTFHHFISLGYFCSVALELERIGLRDASYPFDWIISDFEGVINCINNNFHDFMNISYLAQNKDIRKYYKNTKYGFQFFHDFDQYQSLEKQFPSIAAKYSRRCERFLDTIKENTLFIRYISDEIKDSNGKSLELTWIENNLDFIYSVIKKYNKNNELLFIGNENVISEVITIHHVIPDINDCVSRQFLQKNYYLNNYFMNVDYSGRQKNIQQYKLKSKKKKNIFKIFYRKVIKAFKILFLREYIHSQQY